MAVKVRGESIVGWEVVLLDEDSEAYDWDLCAKRAADFVNDVLHLGKVGEIDGLIETQNDRVLTVRPHRTHRTEA